MSNNTNINSVLLFTFRDTVNSRKNISHEIALHRINKEHYICATTCTNHKLKTSLLVNFTSFDNFKSAANTLRNQPVFDILKKSDLYTH